MSAIAEVRIAVVRAELETADSLLRHFRAPWDEHDTPRPFAELKDALEAQQRALVALTALVESNEAVARVQRGRIESLEMRMP